MSKSKKREAAAKRRELKATPTPDNHIQKPTLNQRTELTARAKQSGIPLGRVYQAWEVQLAVEIAVAHVIKQFEDAAKVFSSDEKSPPTAAA